MTHLTRLLIWSGDPRPVVAETRAELLRQFPGVVDGVRRGLHAIAGDPFANDEWVHQLELMHLQTLQRLAGATALSAPDSLLAAQEHAHAHEHKQEPPHESPELPHPAWVERARSLRVGCWVEWHNGDSRRIRCKLAAVIRASSRYIFVNRSGIKVVEYSESDLAYALAENVIAPLDDSLIFDRALESVIGDLRFSRRR